VPAADAEQAIVTRMASAAHFQTELRDATVFGRRRNTGTLRPAMPKNGYGTRTFEANPRLESQLHHADHLAAMKNLIKFISGFAASLLLTVGLHAAAERLDPMGNDASTSAPDLTTTDKGTVSALSCMPCMPCNGDDN